MLVLWWIEEPNDIFRKDNLMNKLNYLVKTLSRTKRKDYENYVINRVWNRLDDPEIKPISQQYVKRPNGRYALIDLYFPQLNLGIECDEFQHAQVKNEDEKTQDEMRTEDLLSAVENYEEIRIPIYQTIKNGATEKLEFLSLADINKSIDDAVEKIKQIKEKTTDFIPWSDKTDMELAKEQGFIHNHDNFHFRVNSEIRDLFGLGNTKSQRCFYKINHKTDDHLWLPHLAITIDADKITAGSSYGYINLYSMKDGVIYEHLVHNKKSQESLAKSMREPEDFNRITFAKSRDNLGVMGFKFLGIFRKTGKVKTLMINGEEKEFAIHQLVSDKINLNGEFEEM